MNSLPTNNIPRNPHAIIFIGGERYDTWQDKQLVKQVRVELSSDKSSEARFKLFDPRFRHINKFSSSEGVPPLEVLVYMGFGKDLGEPIFKGLLRRVERDSTDSTFIVYDMGYKMRKVRTAEYHKGDDLAIIKKLVERNGLKFSPPDEVDPPLEHHDSMIQDFKNDWEHTMERAGEAGFVIYVRQDTLFCKNPAKLTSPILTLTHRKDFYLLHDFSLSYKLPENELGRHKQVEYRGRKRSGKRLTGKSKEHNRGHVQIVGNHPLAEHTPKWAKRRAHAHKELHREPAWQCTIRSIPPLPQLRPDVRNTIELREVGKLFSGSYICDQVAHELTGNSFETEYDLYRDLGS